MPRKRNGYDRYLDHQFREDWSSFYKHLFGAITTADSVNTKKLRREFPEEVDAYRTWTRVGWEAFLAKCTPDNPQVARLREEYE